VVRGRGVSWGRGSVVSASRGSGVLGLSGVGHISHIAVVVVGVVVDSLGPAIGKSDSVGSSDNTVSVVVLLLVEGSLAVVISHGVGEGVGAGLSKVVSDVSGLHWGVVGGGSVDHRLVGGGGGVVSWSSVDHGGVVSGGGVDSVGNNWGGVVGGGVDSVSDNTVSSVQSVGGISNNSSVSSEGLALGGGPVLSLVRLAHGLVADLAMAVSVDWLVGSVVHGGDGSRDWSSNHGGVHGVDGVSNGVSNNRSSVDSVGNNWGSVDSVSNGVSNNRGSVDSVGHNSGLVGGSSDNGLVGGGGLVGGLLGVDSGTFIGDISDVAVISVGGVGHLLDSAIGQSDSV